MLRSSAKTIAGNIALLVVSVSIAAGVAEIILAGALPSPIVWMDPQERYIGDPVLGHKLVPEQVAYTHSFPVRTNSFGFRDREFSLAPPPGVVRILCLGDSLTFGAGVAEEDTYPRQLEALLNARRQQRYEVINTGVPGYDTWQEIEFFRRQGIGFHPDVVIIGFYANDVVPRPPRVIMPDQETGRVSRNGFDWLVPDSLVHKLKQSRLLLIFRDRFVKLLNQVAPSSAYLHQRAMLNGTPDDFLVNGWLEVEKSLKEMRDLQRTGKFQLLLVVFPMAEQLLREYPHAEYQRRLRVLAEKHDIPFLDLTPALERTFRGFGSLFIEWDGHPNATAFSIAAKEIEPYVVRGMQRP